MKIHFLIIPFLLVLLSSCAVKQKGNRFTDPDLPQLGINFPFEVALLKKESFNTGDKKGIVYYLVTDGLDFEKHFEEALKGIPDTGPVYHTGLEYQILIIKEELLGGRYYTKDLQPSGDNGIFQYYNESGDCLVSIEDEKLQSALTGNTIKYLSNNKAIRIRVWQTIGYVSSPSDWIKNNQEKIKTFTGYMENICSQFLK